MVWWIPRAPSGSQTPANGLPWITVPSGPGVGRSPLRVMSPSASQCATPKSPVPVPVIQVPTRGWVAIAVAASWAAAGRGEAGGANPRPPAPRPASAARRETELVIGRVIGGLLTVMHDEPDVNTMAAQRIPAVL